MRAWTVYGLLLLASAGYVSGLATGWDRWGQGDWDQFRFRYETPRTAMLRDGQVPTWNPYTGGGNVLLAHPHCPAFSPWYLPTLLFGASAGLRLQVLMFVALGSVGMAVLLRQWGVSAAGCFAGGVLLMMSAHFTMHVAEGHLEWCMLGLMPWVVWCLVRARAVGAVVQLPPQRRRWVVAGALVLASALLHGSVYIVAVFVPVLMIWAALESCRDRHWHAVGRAAAMVGLTSLLCAVVLLPRLAFLRSNPRDTRRHEQIAPAAAAVALLDPRQADLFRATRDFRNPPDAELAKLLPEQLPLLARRYETQSWHRLEITLSTTSDWTELRFEGFPYILLIGEPASAGEPPTPRKTVEKSARELDLITPSTEGLALKDARVGNPASVRATLYARLPDRGGLRMAITRGNQGATTLKIVRGKEVLLQEEHGGTVRGASGNRQTLTIPRHVILGRDPPAEVSHDAPWYRLEATLTSTADWCETRVLGCPYLFVVEPPEVERQAPVRLSLRPMDFGAGDSAAGESGGKTTTGGPPVTTTLRTVLCFQRGAQGGLRVRIEQGRLGTSTLRLRTPQGELLETDLHEERSPDGDVTREYLLPDRIIRQCLKRERLEPTSKPWRWRLNEMGMPDDWHEYTCYLTWIGLAAAVAGLAVSLRRHWPLYCAGLTALLLALGATLPLNLWTLWKWLPMYGSLQVSSRFLAVVVFVAAVGGGYGIDCFGRLAEKWGRVSFSLRRGDVLPFGAEGEKETRPLFAWGMALAIYAELAVLGWNLFSGVFVCPPRPVPAHEHFAQRYAAEDDVRYAAMHSAHEPYLRANSGVLREYENIAVPRGKVRLESDPDYRGEAYLQTQHGQSEIAEWSMSRVKVALDGVDAPNRLVLNQNYFPGWKALRRGEDGTCEKLLAEPAPGEHAKGLVSVPIRPGDRSVEFYYLPDSFLLGGAISLATLLGCVGFLLFGRRDSRLRWRLMLAAARIARQGGTWLRPSTVRYVACAVVLNLPFLLCHPGRTLIDAPLLRSLAVNSVLFLAPGLPLVGALIGRRWLPRGGLLWVIAASLVVFVSVLAGMHLVGRPITGAAVWNVTWVLTNLGFAINALSGGPPACGVRLPGGRGFRDLGIWGFRRRKARNPEIPKSRNPQIPSSTWVGILMFAMAYLAFFQGATVIVPVMDDHDYETQGTAYGLLERGQMTLLTDRGTDFYFAHPPLVHVYVAGSFLYYAQKDDLAYYDAAWHRVRLAEQGQRVSVREMEVQLLYDRFQRNSHHRAATRSANVFLAALTVGLLGAWIARMTGHWWLGLLAASAFAANPEVFVRSSYGGYFAISMFAAVQILLAVEARTKRRLPSERGFGDLGIWGFRGRKARNPQPANPEPRNPEIPSGAWMTCLLAGGFAGLSNHKLVLLPVAVIVWELIRSAQTPLSKRAIRALLDPVAIGFAAGTIIFWAYGLAVSPNAFWLEHVRHHLVDRIVHENPLGYGGYPAVGELWLEFWQHTGYVLLPLAVVALAATCARRRTASDCAEISGAATGWRDTPGLWTVWMLLTAVAFSLVDWRQTKHLMPLLLSMHLAPALWAASGRVALAIVTVALAGLLLWDLEMLRLLVANFGSFSITPAW